MSKITIIEGNSNDKDNVRVLMVKGEKGDLNHNDIVDNLTSANSTKVLSAKQGKILKGLVDENTTGISNLERQVTGLASGSPLVASSISEMTDTTRVYVNTSDGSWYYYDGTSWQIGGTYQSSGISDGSIDILMFDNLLQSNFFINYSQPLDIGEAHDGYYINTGEYLNSDKNSYYEYELENGKTYIFNGENNYRLAGLIVKDGEGNLVYSSNQNINVRENITRIFKCNQNNLTAYLSYTKAILNTDIRYYNFIFREITDVYNMLKYSNNIPIIKTIQGFPSASNIGTNHIKITLGASYSTKMYQLSKGRTYKINYWNYSDICGLVVATNENQIIYASSDSNIHDTLENDDYTFTANNDGYILLTTFTASGSQRIPSIEIVEPNIELPTQDNSVLTNKSITFNGDSICAGSGYTGGYGKIISDKYNMTYENIAVGGGTIASETYYSSSGTARHWINATITNMNSDYDYAILEGGVNDSSLEVPLGSISSGYNATLDTSTYYGAFENMLKQLIIRFAGKKYGYIAVHQMANNYRIINDPATSYYWAAKKCCEKWGVPFLDLNDKVPPFNFFKSDGNPDLYALRNTYTKDGDGWHPTEEGYRKYYVDKIISWLETL